MIELNSRHSVDITGVDTKVNDTSSEWVHHYQHPVTAKANRLTPEELDTPQAVLGVTRESQPRRTITGLRLVVFGEHSAHDVFVDVDTESPGYDQRYPWAAETWIAALQLDDGIDDFLGRPLRSRFSPRFRCEQRPLLAAHQTPVKAQLCRWLQSHRKLFEPRRSQEKRAQVEKEPVTS